MTVHLAELSNELREPLDEVVGLSAVLARQSDGPLNAQQVDCVTRIESSGRRLAAVITKVLELARAESDRPQADAVDVDVAQMISEAVGIVRGLADDKRIVVSIDDPDDVRLINATPARARQVLVNLLSNAIKLTESGGHIAVRSHRQGSVVAVTLHDTGVGIPSEHVEFVFEPVGRVGSPLSRQVPSSGRGLAVAAGRPTIPADGCVSAAS
jgi:two-component system cell cycle sensor histidine kinase PleC